MQHPTVPPPHTPQDPIVLSPQYPATRPRRPRLVFKAHRLVYHSTLGLRVIKKKKTLRNQSLRRTPYANQDSDASAFITTWEREFDPLIRGSLVKGSRTPMAQGRSTKIISTIDQYAPEGG